MDENFSATEQTAWVYWVRASQSVMEHVENALKEQGFSGLDWYDALLELDCAPMGRLRLSELAERMLLKKFNITRLIDRLESKGYVKREICADDARGAYASITPAGKAARRKIWPIYRDAVRAHFLKNLGEKDRVALIKLINLIEKP